jgi:hypothetical protein
VPGERAREVAQRTGRRARRSRTRMAGVRRLASAPAASPIGAGCPVSPHPGIAVLKYISASHTRSELHNNRAICPGGTGLVPMIVTLQ